MIFWIIFPDAQNSETAKTGVFFGEALPQLSLEFFEVSVLLNDTRPYSLNYCYILNVMIYSTSNCFIVIFFLKIIKSTALQLFYFAPTVRLCTVYFLIIGRPMYSIQMPRSPAVDVRRGRDRQRWTLPENEAVERNTPNN